MPDDTDMPAPRARGERKALPTHVILLADWAAHLAGRVLRADADLISHLDRDGARWRAATEREISLAAL